MFLHTPSQPTQGQPPLSLFITGSGPTSPLTVHHRLRASLSSHCSSQAQGRLVANLPSHCSSQAQGQPPLSLFITGSGPAFPLTVHHRLRANLPSHCSSQAQGQPPLSFILSHHVELCLTKNNPARLSQLNF